MGRKRHKCEEQDLPPALVVYSKVTTSKADEQNSGGAFYGRSVDGVEERQPLAPTFYPLRLQAPPPPDVVPAFQPDQFHVEVADPTLLATSIPDLLQALLDASGPPPTVRNGASGNSRPVPTLKPAEEKALVEKLRKDGRTWTQIAGTIGVKSASTLRKKYTKQERQDAQQQQQPQGTPTATPAASQNHTGVPAAAGSAPLPRASTPPPFGMQRAPSPAMKLHAPAQKADSSGSADNRTPKASDNRTPKAGNAGNQRDPRLAAAGGSQRAESGGQQQGGPWQQMSLAPVSEGETLVHGIRLRDMVNLHATNRAGGEDRVTLKRQLKRMPEGFTGLQAHGLKTLAGVKFFEEVVVQDPDDPDRMYHFSVSDSVHGPCFHLGEGPDGSPLLSWSDIFALYQLPDGSKWAEHGYYNDAEDLEQLGKRLGRSHTAVLPSDMGTQELLRRQGRYHSRLQNIEYECWLYKDKLPDSLLPCPPDEAFYWRHTFSPYTLERC